MILEAILVLSGVSALGNIINLCMKNKEVPSKISIKKQMTGTLPVITLNNNGIALNFLIDTGSNMSHICPSAVSHIECKCTEDNNTIVAGLGGTTTGTTVCNAKFKDTMNKEYELSLLVSESLEYTTKCIEESTGIKIHGLLGTDFLQKYKYIIDFKELEIYVKK